MPSEVAEAATASNNKHSIFNKSLFKAVARNDLKDIYRLVKLGADINSEFTIAELISNKLIDDNAIAILKNAEISADQLIRNRYVGKIPVRNVEISSMKRHSHSKIIPLPIEMNIIMLSAESKLSPLQLATMYGFKDAIIELIKKGANPNKTLDIQGFTILQLLCTAAVLRGPKCYIFDDEIVQLLFEHGADPNIQDIEGRTFLHFFVRCSDFGLYNTVKYVELGKLSDYDRCAARSIEMFLINGANPNIKDNYTHNTVLYYVIQHDAYLYEQPNLTHLLLDHEGSYGMYEDALKEPSTVSLMQDPDLGDFNSYAKRAKEDVDDFNSEHKHHMTKNNRLIEAIKNRNESKVKTLLKEGTSPNIRDKDGLSALHLAIKFGDKAIIELLLSKGAHPNIKSWKNGTTPIFNAVIDNRNDLVELLLSHGANPSVINTKDLSPLYFSVTSNNEEMSKLLCEYNANPDISRQIPILFTVLNGIKNKTDDTTMTENILLKIKNVAEFLQSQNVPVDYSLFYESIDIAERNNERNIVKKIMKLLDELIYVSAPTS